MKHSIPCDLIHRFLWKKWTSRTPTARLQVIPAGQEHILEQDDDKNRWVRVVTEFSHIRAVKYLVWGNGGVEEGVGSRMPAKPVARQAI